MKKRGFGVGNWNGVGGKVQSEETPEQAVVRETEEEIGVLVTENDLEKVATILFLFVDEHADWNQECHVYLSKKWQGQPQESEEMKPQWYTFSDIPYDTMWIGDDLWIPLVLAGKKIEATLYFSDGGKVLKKHEIREV